MIRLSALSQVGTIFSLQMVEVPAGSLLEATEELDFLPGFAFEGFPNRDSTSYIDPYNIPEARTVQRGTIRYRGYSQHVIGLIKMGLLDTEPHPCLHPGGPDLTWVNPFFSEISRRVMSLSLFIG